MTADAGSGAETPDNVVSDVRDGFFTWNGLRISINAWWEAWNEMAPETKRFSFSTGPEVMMLAFRKTVHGDG